MHQILVRKQEEQTHFFPLIIELKRLFSYTRGRLNKEGAKLGGIRRVVPIGLAIISA